MTQLTYHHIRNVYEAADDPDNRTIPLHCAQKLMEIAKAANEAFEATQQIIGAHNTLALINNSDPAERLVTEIFYHIATAQNISDAEIASLSDHIDMEKPRIPTFLEKAERCLLALEQGTVEDRGWARSELKRFARELDRLSATTGASFYPDDTPIEGE